MLFVIVRVELYEVSPHVPPLLVALPVIVVPSALHALSASPLKLSPIFLSDSPVTVPLVAAFTGMLTAGSIAATSANMSVNDKNLFTMFFTSDMFRTLFIFSSCLILFCPYFKIYA